MTHLQGAVTAKYILAKTGIIPSDRVRLPLVAPTAEELAPVLAELEEAGRPL